jgi:aspartokinase/homoserine dehydrogenase 1
MTVTHPQTTVHKFGGSSVADADCFLRVADIIDASPSHRTGVVLSACKGVTDALLSLVSLAEAQDPSVLPRLNDLRVRHVTLAHSLLGQGEAASAFIARLDADIADISGILNTVRLIRSAATALNDRVAGFGELWSSQVLAALLAQRDQKRSVRWLDAREVVTVEWGPLGPLVQWTRSEQSLASTLAPDWRGVLVIPGFIASTPEGLQTTLGRNGSDFSGSIFGALLKADEIIIWTDVDGVLSADPRRVPDAKIIDSLSYNEAMELAYFGAKVIHPQTMAPAVRLGIPIRIKNTFAPSQPGTLICEHPTSSQPVKGVTTVDAVALLNLEGAGMIGVPGTAQRLFGALREASISVILISQGSSEHSICCAVPNADAQAAAHVVKVAFERELREGQIQRVDVSEGCSILAVVGDGMAGSHGVAAKLFGTLGSAAISVRAIAQGASERNISVVIDARHSSRALQAVHAAFYLSRHTVSIGLIGPGLVGGALIDQILSQTERLKGHAELDLRLRAILNSKQMLLAEGALGEQPWREQLAHSTEPSDLDRFTRHVQAAHLPHAVIIDCSSSPHVAARYSAWLAAGIHIVTPNKKANSGALRDYQAIKEARRVGGSHYLYEATVGAGLPVIQTLRDLRETGDDIRSIEGIFSGTLAYLFNVYDGTVPFSSIVRDAKHKGYTEPDPRDDLSGTDVARKLIILGREMGLALEMSDVRVDSLVPSDLSECTAEEFLNRLPAFDQVLADRYQAAKAKGQVLRYVGRLDIHGKATVGLVTLDAKHPFANIALTDNVVRFETRRYCDNPLIVQGPGAGPEVTAGGVFGDLLRLSAYLGVNL